MSEMREVNVRLAGKQWSIPEVINFEGIKGKCYWHALDFRPPLKGEYYASGAIVEAYIAPADGISTRYLIMQPTHKGVSAWTRGEIIPHNPDPPSSRARLPVRSHWSRTPSNR
jgi:hypothetical protein